MIANQAQVGYLGIPPFLVGWDRGVNWRILTTLSRQDSWLVVKDPTIKSLKVGINLRKAHQHPASCLFSGLRLMPIGV